MLEKEGFGLRNISIQIDWTPCMYNCILFNIYMYQSHAHVASNSIHDMHVHVQTKGPNSMRYCQFTIYISIN
jgi:hypothetical protein